ncbi:MAG: hypothetical protein HOO67_08125 [Candidatus Peribacteraceae bacterium]|nr:hypothetical protein [Candidatus Peribacteraceae bacterium]
MTHFEDACGRFQEDLQQKRIGCVFAHEAARLGKVEYVAFPTDQNGLAQFLEETKTFISNQAKSVLTVILAGGNPFTLEEGKSIAYDSIYATLVLCLSEIGFEVLANHFQDRLSAEAQRLSEIIQAPFISTEKLLELMNTDAMRELICNHFVHEGTLALTYIRSIVRDRIETDALIPLTMAPYYTPIHEGRQHSRFARDFAVVLTRNADINEAFANRVREVAETRDWKTFAVGNDYIEGLHIPLRPPNETGAKVRTVF